MPGCSSNAFGSARQRQESTSSNGSWQVVTDTGSIDSMLNGSYMMRFINQQQQHQQQQLPNNSCTITTTISDKNVSSNVNVSQSINFSNCFAPGSGNCGTGHTYSIQHPPTSASNSSSNSISTGSIGSASGSFVSSNSLGATNVGSGFVNGQLSTNKISL